MWKKRQLEEIISFYTHSAEDLPPSQFFKKKSFLNKESNCVLI